VRTFPQRLPLLPAYENEAAVATPHPPARQDFRLNVRL
jgi:hypothetical protein